MMRNLLKAVVVLCLFCMPYIVNAQKVLKLGHIDSNELLKLMPGRDSAQNELQKHGKELQTTLEGMRTELESKYQAYQAGVSEMSDLIKQSKQKELQDMQARIEEFQTNAQKDLQEREKKLLTPIINKAKAAIEDVAKENKYTYVFDSGVGVLLYSDSSDDLLPLVKKKLNLK